MHKMCPPISNLELLKFYTGVETTGLKAFTSTLGSEELQLGWFKCNIDTIDQNSRTGHSVIFYVTVRPMYE